MLAGLAVLILALGATAQQPFNALRNITGALAPTTSAPALTTTAPAVAVVPAQTGMLDPSVLAAPAPLDVEGLAAPVPLGAVVAPVAVPKSGAKAAATPSSAVDLAGEAPTRVDPSAPPLSVRLTTCTDVPPGKRHTCEEQKAFGKCTSEFVLRYAYCARTCGLPPCAKELAAAGNSTATTTTIATPAAPKTNGVAIAAPVQPAAPITPPAPKPAPTEAAAVGVFPGGVAAANTPRPAPPPAVAPTSPSPSSPSPSPSPSPLPLSLH
ncbi:hypothetical protein V8C86DRAFT_1634827 [Haematococcus lacustris]